MNNHFDSKLDPCISAYRKKHSCETTLLRLTEDWKLAVDSEQFRGTQRQFSENICSEDDLRSRIFGHLL